MRPNTAHHSDPDGDLRLADAMAEHRAGRLQRALEGYRLLDRAGPRPAVRAAALLGAIQIVTGEDRALRSMALATGLMSRLRRMAATSADATVSQMAMAARALIDDARNDARVDRGIRADQRRIQQLERELSSCEARAGDC